MAGIFNQSFGGGVQTGVTLADKVQERRDRSRLQELADLARGGLGNADIANQIGAGLIGLGQAGAGIRAQDIPYQRAQQQAEFDALQSHRQGTLAARNAQLARPASTLGKLRDDFIKGKITQEEYTAAFKKMTTNNSGIEISPDGTVRIGAGPSQGAFAKDAGKAEAGQIDAARTSAAAARELKSTITQMRQLLPDLGYTGPVGGFVGGVDDLIGALPGDKGARGAFKNMSLEAQLSMTEKTKGAITDREMGMFKAAVPSLSQTPEGNEQIIRVMEAAADRAIQRVTVMEQYRAANGTLEGFEQQWDEYLDRNPLILGRQDGELQLSEELSQ